MTPVRAVLTSQLRGRARSHAYARALRGLGLRHHDDLVDAAAVHVALQPLGRLDGLRAERRDPVVAGDRHRLAVLEHRGGRSDLADRVHEATDYLERGLTAAEDEGGGVESADGAHDALGR